jgi:uncharacterized protein (DUF427 family)
MAMSDSTAASRPVKIPGPDHPITIEANPGRIVVSVDGRQVADTREALTLSEAGYAPVQYIPLGDVNRELLTPSDHGTYCPYKGEASYYSIPSAGERGLNAVWEYRNPYDAVAQIRGHVAFYPDRVEVDERFGS